uniref:Ribosomal protein S20 n=1 Tax=Gronococcus sybilensis TaxID=3028029 RepID=A0A9Y1MX26_9RHOD|nr:ribosomal protein S20 [Gronococcus sybilensis]
MANIKSAIKNIRVAERNRQQNNSYKSAIKTLSKKYYQSLKKFPAHDSVELQSQLSRVYSKIDKAVAKNVLPKNTAARKKSTLLRSYKKVVKSL